MEATSAIVEGSKLELGKPIEIIYATKVNRVCL